MIRFFLRRVFRSYIGSAEKGQEYQEIHDQSGDITCMSAGGPLVLALCSLHNMLWNMQCVSGH